MERNEESVWENYVCGFGEAMIRLQKMKKEL